MLRRMEILQFVFDDDELGHLHPRTLENTFSTTLQYDRWSERVDRALRMIVSPLDKHWFLHNLFPFDESIPIANSYLEQLDHLLLFEFPSCVRLAHRGFVGHIGVIAHRRSLWIHMGKLRLGVAQDLL